MLTYNPRSTIFINFVESIPAFVPQGIIYFRNEDYVPDIIHVFGLHVSKEGKSYTRTRRKFVDDVATRGGQYSSAVIVLTALYYLF